MRLLALETATPAGGAALLDGDRLVAEYILNIRVTHSERLMATVDRLLSDSGWDLDRLEGLAVSVGPGSFTGLRIGVSTAKGLALALGTPLAAVPTLDALAHALPFTSDPVCPILDAKKGEVYASLYRWDGESAVREWDYLALTPEALCRRLSGPVVFVGDAVASVGEFLAATLGPRARFAPPEHCVPSPACVAQLGHARLVAGQTVDPAALTPIYIRPSEAELRRRRALQFS
ncbi:MAG: tRNA (adenosine(37)-N6)-threonylcarbamoyltransferase complex dimerization subunit type 1 TsaB [Candidatus Rokubacteria bacterium]|nr:tRNA (adenosine(37)-N6)-threonylcarbamoyltransferase complex dimerization subunit type 1 TsaB [Candidatus Rokubacteria bacterium]